MNFYQFNTLLFLPEALASYWLINWFYWLHFTAPSEAIGIIDCTLLIVSINLCDWPYWLYLQCRRRPSPSWELWSSSWSSSSSSSVTWTSSCASPPVGDSPVWKITQRKAKRRMNWVSWWKAWWHTGLNRHWPSIQWHTDRLGSRALRRM